MTALEKWIELRKSAGFTSDRALERALGITAGQIWQWIVKGREPHLGTFRKMSKLLGVPMDALDSTIVNWRAEVEQGASAAAVGGA